ncbi:MAG: hypothetical protein R3F61_36015 [Myxococcota bacterium]
MLVALLGLFLSTFLGTPAHAQRRVSVDRVATAPLPVGRAVVVHVDTFDDAISLDPDVLELTVVDPESFELLGKRPGVATLLVLRGGLTESIVVTLDGTPVDREAFTPLGLVPEDGVPFWRAEATLRLGGSAKSDPLLTRSLGASVGYRSQEAGITHLSSALAQSSGEGWGFRTLLSTTSTRRFDLALGDVYLAPTPGRAAFTLRGISAAVRPTDGDFQADLTVGNTRQLECCGVFDPNGEVVAVAGAKLGYGDSSTRISAGALVPRTDPEVLPVAWIEQGFEGKRFRGLATVGRVGDGTTGSLAAGYATPSTRVRLAGYHNGRGAWVPGLGPAPESETWMVGGADRRVGDALILQLDGNVRDSRAPDASLTSAALGAGATFGTGTRVGGRYGVSLGWADGAFDPESFRHLLQGTVSSQGRRRFRMSSNLSVALDRGLGFRQGLWRLYASSDLGPLLRIGPYAWGIASESSGVAGAGARLSLERARVESQLSAGLQTSVASGTLDPRGLAESRVAWSFAGWGSLFGGASFVVPVKTGTFSYSLTTGLKLGGNVRDVRGALTGGGVVSGTVFVDVDGDGRLGERDYGVQGVSVTVLDQTVVSGEGGRYRLRGLKPSTYQVGVESSGYLLRDGDRLAVDVNGFGKADLDIALVQRRRLDVHVFADRNDNRVLDVGEWGVDAEMITVTGPEGTDVVSATAGVATLEELPQGTYEVELSAALLDERYLPLGATSKSVVVDQRGFQRVLFAVRPVRKLAGKVCRDLNDNGRLDGADVCEEGVDVTLSSGETQKTGPGGAFAFEPVPPGDLHVSVRGVDSETVRVTEYPIDRDDLRILLPYVQPPAPEPSPDRPEDTRLVALRLQLEDTRLKVGERVGFEVTATFASLLQTRVEKPDLVIGDPTVARVIDGRLFAVSEGRTRVEAVSGRVRSPAIELEVRRLPVVGLVARPARVELPFGEVTTLGARAIFVDGDSQEVGDRVDWSCQDPQVCRVEGNGVFVAVGPGSTTLRADYLGVASQPVEVRVTTGDAVPTQMAIAPAQLTLGLQSTGRMYVDADLSNGHQVHLTTQVEWSTDAPDVIEILPGGRIRPVSVGKAVVTASFKGVESRSSTVEVVPAVGLVIVPTVGVVPAGVSVPIRLYEVLGDGSYQEVQKARWESDSPAIARVEDGRVVTNQPGKAALVARYRGNASLPMHLEVVASGLAGLRATREALLVEAGEITYIDGLATFRDGMETVATSVVQWESRNPAVATVSEDGEVVGVGPGRTVITGTWLGWSTAPVEVLVGAGVSAAPEAILVEPAAISMSAQGRQPLAVSVLSAEGRILPDDKVRWEVGDPSVAWVERNEVRAVSVGATEIVAVQGDVRSLPVSVDVRPIVGVTADPALGRLPVGARVDLRALAVVDDGSAEELRDGVRWTSSDPDILRIDDEGELLAFKAGRASVTATWRGMKTLPMPVQVADTDLVDLTIDPGQASLRVGEALPLAVVAVFGDGTITDATPHVTWTSTRPSIASADAALLEGVEPGVAEVFATWMGLGSAPIRVTVAPADAVGVILGNASEVVLLGRRLALRATAVTADGKLLDATEQTLWDVRDPSVVKVDANGYLEALAPGSTTLVGVVGGQESPPLALEVVDAPIVRLDVTPSALAVRPGEPVDLVVTAHLEGGRTVDVTPQVTWEIEGPGVAVDRYDRLIVGRDAKARVRARIDDVASGWAEIVSTP